MEDFDDLLTWCDAAKDCFPECLFLHTGDEFLGDLKIDISLQECEANLAQRGVDVRFADRAVATQLFENVLELIAELRKHNVSSLGDYTRLACGRSHSRDRELFYKDCFRETPKPARGTRALPGSSSLNYFFAVGAGFAGAGAGAPAAAASMPKVQCASTFLPSDFALTITVHEFSRSFCVT